MAQLKRLIAKDHRDQWGVWENGLFYTFEERDYAVVAAGLSGPLATILTPGKFAVRGSGRPWPDGSMTANDWVWETRLVPMGAAS